MGSPNADFFIREVRESLTGDMIVVRRVEYVRFHVQDVESTIGKGLDLVGALQICP
jgi:hypothetical protein